MGVVAANLVWFALQAVIDFGFADGWQLPRKCARCGCRYTSSMRTRPDYDKCPHCEYNLTGNTSGRCPECGWKLARRYRLHRKAANQQLPPDS